MSDLFNTGIRPVVDAWLLAKAKEQRDYGEYWSASSAGYCMRKVIFERLGVPKIESDGDARKQRVFTSGHLFHSWVQGITKEAGLSIAQELELQDEELMIRGHIDDLVLVNKGVGEAYFDDSEQGGQTDVLAPPKHLILYDYKTVNSRSFIWAKKNGNAMSHYHRMQLGTYMYMLRNGGKAVVDTRGEGFSRGMVASIQDGTILPTNNLTEARILKIEKDTLMMNEQQLIWTPDLEKEVVGYWSTLNGYWKAKKIPQCTCHLYENGFLAKELYNGYFFNGEPCSIDWYQKWKMEKEHGLKLTSDDFPPEEDLEHDYSDRFKA